MLWTSVVDEHWPIDPHEDSEGQRKRHPRDLIDLASQLAAVRIPSLPVPVGVFIYESFCLRGVERRKRRKRRGENGRETKEIKRKQRREGNNEETKGVRGEKRKAEKENKKE